MNKYIAVTAVALLALAAPASGAAGGREVTENYSMGSGAVVSHGTVSDTEVHWTAGSQYLQFRAERGERFVSVVAEDTSGQPVAGHVHIDRDNDGKVDHEIDFCEKTAKPIAVTAGSVVEVGAIFGSCDDSWSIVTEGSITATFTR
jgi:hypothetical protein